MIHLFKKTETMSIKEFMNREYEIKNKNMVNKIALSSILPLAITTPAFAESDLSNVISSKLYEKVIHAFDPLVVLVQALSYPIGLTVMLGGGLFIMIGNREKGFSLIQQAGMGYILVQMLPLLMDLLVDISKAI
jgi:hypothetical protein